MNIPVIKQLLAKTFSVPMEDYLEMERQTQIKTASSEDFKEGVNAFLEKREPNYQGK